jgi:sporulation protein YlmC with PRC-barrel domain
LTIIFIAGDRFRHSRDAGMPIELSSIERKHVITKDGRNLGDMVGSNIDTSKWTVTSIIVELHADMVKPLNQKKPFMGKARIKVRTDFIGVVGDVIQLTLDLDMLKTHL